MIGKKLKEYRQRFKLTGTTLAKLAGINQPYLSEIENEKKVPPMDTFINLVNALAKIAPFNYENSDEILTEECYQDFKSIVSIHGYTRENSKLTFVTIYFPDNDKLSNFSFDTAIDTQSLTQDLYNDELVDEWLRSLFFDKECFDTNSFHHYFNYFDIENNDIYGYIPAFLDDTRHLLYKWWYNHILQDIMRDGIQDNVIYVDKEINDIDTSLFAYKSNISEGDRKLLAEFWPLMDKNGQFTPYNDDDNTNISKDLLNGKTVTFDIRSITDKNVRALLDGQLLSNDELTAIKFTLNGIRYNREQNRK